MTFIPGCRVCSPVRCSCPRPRDLTELAATTLRDQVNDTRDHDPGDEQPRSRS